MRANNYSQYTKPSVTILNISNNQSKAEDLFKDSLENSCVNMSKENILIPDSLNNSLMQNMNTLQDSITNQMPQIKAKEVERKSEEETKKIEYKYVTNYPIKKTTQDIVINDKYYWFAAYGKLIKTKNVLKIIRYYLKKEPDYTIKQKGIVIKNFELTFGNDSKPYIHHSKGGYIFAKLYYLSIEEINCIFNYVNKIEHKFNKDSFIFNNNIGDNCKIEHNDINFPYNYLYCLGSFMNINIYSFSNLSLSLWKSVDLSKQFPKSKKIYKITKYLIDVFPSYSSDFFIYYLFSDIRNNISNAALTDKVSEVKSFFTKKKLYMSSNNNTDSSIQSININNINLNVKVTTNKMKSTKSKTGHVPKLNSNTQFSSCVNNSIRNEMTMISKHSAVKSLNYSKQSNAYNPLQAFGFTNSNKGNVNKTYGPSNKGQTSEKRSNVYVVSRKLKSDIDFEYDDDSSVNTKKSIPQEKKVYVTPKKNKITKYYS